MLFIPRTYSHYLFALMQSGISCGIATAIACHPFLEGGSSGIKWLQSWIMAWIVIAPIVLLLAPIIHRVVRALTSDTHLKDDA
jgi:hypothetical protein